MSKPKVLFMGMPKVDSSFYEMNIAQLPQGPRVLFLEKILHALKLSSATKRKIRMATRLENIFNPKRKSPYMGMRLIVQNLSPFFDITLVEYPRNNRWIRQYIKNNKNLYFIGISIGCENRVYHARDLARQIQHIAPHIPIVFGNYGATAAKLLQIIPPELGTILWDSEEERKAKASQGKDFYKGEGVHDTRLWLREQMNMDVGDPNGPIISQAVSDSGVSTKSKLLLSLKSFAGFLTMPKDSHKLVSAIGCSNSCDFCNSSKIFNREKTFLYQKAKDIFVPMEKIYDQNLQKKHFPPEANFFIMDENFMKDEKVNAVDGKINFLEVVEELCDYIEKSKKNIHFGTFSDTKSLFSYRKKQGNFRKLVQGGITSIWIGIESREDAFDKRGGASPETVKEIVDELQSLGIVVIGSFIADLGYHTEKETIIKEEKNEEGLKSTIESLNIWEDAQWWRSLNTGARQVMMHSITGVVGKHNLMFNFSDYEFGHRAIPGHNSSQISGKRLEEIDERLRELFYEENGPVALSSLLVMWNGFMTLKDSDNEAEVRSATFCYWMVKRNLQRVSLITFLFNKRIFTPCSDTFLKRLAKMFQDVDRYSPPDTDLNRHYSTVYAYYEKKNSQWSADVARKNREKFITRYV